MGYRGDFVQRFIIDARTKLVVVGALQGAYHSFVRYLEKMYELGFISKDLKFTSSNIYFISLGNVINRSPYTSETFQLMLYLMKQNPDQVLYLRGSNEAAIEWDTHAIRNELEAGARAFSDENIPLFTPVMSFFKTLPYELYGVMHYLKTETELPYIAVSAYIKDKELLNKINEQRYPKFLADQGNGRPAVFNLNSSESLVQDDMQQKITLKAAIRDIKKRDSYEQMDGLRNLPMEGDATAWTVLSCPTVVYRMALKFYYDAFLCVSAGDSFAKWKATLYNRRVDNKDFVFAARDVNFFGEVVEKKSTQKEVVQPQVAKEVEPIAVQPSKPKKADKQADKKEKRAVEPSEKTPVVADKPKAAKETKGVQPVEAEVTTAHAAPASVSVTAAQLAFYKELVAQVHQLKNEVVNVRSSILKELQKFEVAAPAEHKPAPAAPVQPAGPAAKKQVLDESLQQSSKLGDAINQALKEIKSIKPEITIHNHVNGAAQDEHKARVLSTPEQQMQTQGATIAALVATVQSLKEELKQQRVVTQKILEQEVE
jgi:hypothetical protein